MAWIKLTAPLRSAVVILDYQSAVLVPPPFLFLSLYISRSSTFRKICFPSLTSSRSSDCAADAFARLQGSPFEDLRDVTRDESGGDASKAGGLRERVGGGGVGGASVGRQAFQETLKVGFSPFLTGGTRGKMTFAGVELRPRYFLLSSDCELVNVTSASDPSLHPLADIFINRFQFTKAQ